jgi:long-subunit acyl-CoA synthetase (AMP-forming)
LEFGVLKQLERAANQHNLDSVEKVMRVLIVEEPFSAANGLLTSTHKMKREAIKMKYSVEIEHLYMQVVNDKTNRLEM